MPWSASPVLGWSDRHGESAPRGPVAVTQVGKKRVPLARWMPEGRGHSLPRASVQRIKTLALMQSALSAHLSKTFKRPPFAQYSRAQICVCFSLFPCSSEPPAYGLHHMRLSSRVGNLAPLVIPLPGYATSESHRRLAGPTLPISTSPSDSPAAPRIPAKEPHSVA